MLCKWIVSVATAIIPSNRDEYGWAGCCPRTSQYIDWLTDVKKGKKRNEKQKFYLDKR